MLESLLVFCLAAAGSLLGGTVSVIIGGMGATRILQRRVTALEDDVQEQEARITREVKQRAARSARESMETGKSADVEILAEALKLRRGNGITAPNLPGRP